MKIPESGWKALILLSCLCLTAACASTPAADLRTAAVPPDLNLELGDQDALLVGAGDIADCGSAPALATGDLIRSLILKFPSATVFTAGDNAYRNGTARQFTRCYDPVWGSFKDRTRPSPGNHDYGIYPPAHRDNADPYFHHFGANAGPAGKGFYSFDLGGWHIVSLNSMAGEVSGAPSMSDQVNWLRTDLESTEKPCILAYWHHPLFSSGPHGHDSADPGRRMGPLWDVLYQHHADVIVNGHDHHYERFAPQNPSGAADPQGIRELLVGNGGAETRPIQGVQPNSEFQLDGRSDFGVLLLALRPNGYEWRFLKIDGTVGDTSTGPQECH